MPGERLFTMHNSRNRDQDFCISPVVKGKMMSDCSKDKRMEIGLYGNFDMLFSKGYVPSILNFTHEGCNLQSKMADIENVNFQYDFK